MHELGNTGTADAQAAAPWRRYDVLVDAVHQIYRGAYRYVPVVDEQQRLTVLVSMQTIISYLIEMFSQELLNLPPFLAHSAQKRQS